MQRRAICADWCDNLGYDDDSIKALNTFQHCVDTATALELVFDSAQMTELREALQDY